MCTPFPTIFLTVLALVKNQVLHVFILLLWPVLCVSVLRVCLCVVSTVYYFLLKSNYYIFYPVFPASRTLLRPMLGLFQLCFYLLNLHYFLC